MYLYNIVGAATHIGYSLYDCLVYKLYQFDAEFDSRV